MRRKKNGEYLAPHQFANDWISVNRKDCSAAGIVSPRAVILDAEDFEFFRSQQDPRHVGTFWSEWELQDDGSFRSLRPRAARRGRR